MRIAARLCCAFAVLPVSGFAAAQATDMVRLDATYLNAPTDWCAADMGVPLVITMDGPNVVAPPDAFPVTVRERRGTQSSGIVFSGQSTNSLRKKPDLSKAEVIGRFSAEVQGCHSLWTTFRVSGTWQLTRPDGAKLDAGRIEDESLGFSDLPFFKSVSQYSDAMFATLGERHVFTTGTPDVTLSQTFAAEPDKE